mgnify:CR=1 FL=1
MLKYSNILHPLTHVLHPRTHVLHPHTHVLHPRTHILYPRTHILHHRTHVLHPRTHVYKLMNYSKLALSNVSYLFVWSNEYFIYQHCTPMKLIIDIS